MHLRQLRAMEASLRQSAGKEAALAKIQGEIARIRQEFELGDDDLPMPQRRAKAAPSPPPRTRPFEPEDFSRTSRSLEEEIAAFALRSSDEGGLGLHPRAALEWTKAQLRGGVNATGWADFRQRFELASYFLRTEGGGFDRAVASEAMALANRYDLAGLRSFLATYARALAFAKESQGSQGLGLGGENAREWAEHRAHQGEAALGAYLRRYREAYEFAQKSVEAGGFGLFRPAEISPWARDWASRKSSEQHYEFVKKFELASQFAQESKDQGGLGLHGWDAVQWAIGLAKERTLAEIEAFRDLRRSNFRCDQAYARF